MIIYFSYIDVEIWEADNRFGEIIGRFPLQKFRISADSIRNGEWNINRWTINAPYRFKGTFQKKPNRRFIAYTKAEMYEVVHKK